MKIFINIMSPQILVAEYINSDTFPVDIEWCLEDGTYQTTNAVMIPWSSLSTSLSLNASIRAAAIDVVYDQGGYTFNPLTDHIFFMGGFTAM